MFWKWCSCVHKRSSSCFVSWVWHWKTHKLNIILQTHEKIFWPLLPCTSNFQCNMSSANTIYSLTQWTVQHFLWYFVVIVLCPVKEITVTVMFYQPHVHLEIAALKADFVQAQFRAAIFGMCWTLPKWRFRWHLWSQAFTGFRSSMLQTQCILHTFCIVLLNCVKRF